MKNKFLLLYILIFFGPLISFASCPGDTARFTTVAGACNNKTISFVNTSVGATTYFWDFGDGATLGDTSNLQNPPAYTYPALGSYTAMLIVDKGTGCADTFTTLVNMAFVTAGFTSNAPQCVTNSVLFNDTSVVGPGGGTITNWHWDFGETGNSDTSALQNTSHTYSLGNQAFFVILVVTSSDGCKDTTTTGVGIQSVVIVNAGTDIISCKNNTTVNLSGSVQNAGGGNWSGSGAFFPIIFPPSLTPIYTPTAAAKANGVDTVILTSLPSYCPSVSDTVLIFFNPAPTVDVGGDISVCKDVGSIPVSATITGATGGIWHTTSSEGTFTDDDSLSTFYHPGLSDTAAGSVTLYLESTGNGICAASRDSLVLTFTPLPTVIIKTEDSSCSGNPILLDVTVSTGAGTWSSSGTGTFLPNATTLNGVYYPSADDNLAGMVTLRFVSGNNNDCQPVEDSLIVTIKPSPVAAFSAVSACAGDAVQFNDSSSISSGSITSWNWTFGDLSLPSLSQSPSHIYSSCGSKTVTLVVTADNGCIDSNVESIPVYCLPLANYTAVGVCLKDGTAFTNTSTVSSATIASSSWNFGDMTSSTATNPTHLFPSSGSFPVILVVQSSQGCLDTLTQTVSLVSGPVAAFTISDATADIAQNITFQDQSTDAVDWSWDYGDGFNSSGLSHPSHAFTVGGVYDVCLIVTDPSGCTDTVCQQEIVSTDPHGPSAFSPNGDGQNDIFYVYGGPYKRMEFKVYNNWGEVIFVSDKQSLGWDGKYNGVEQPVGVYIYTIMGVTEDDKEYKISGDVTLLR